VASLTLPSSSPLIPINILEYIYIVKIDTTLHQNAEEYDYLPLRPITVLIIIELVADVGKDVEGRKVGLDGPDEGSLVGLKVLMKLGTTDGIKVGSNVGRNDGS
jgi:hypothetical protein